MNKKQNKVLFAGAIFLIVFISSAILYLIASNKKPLVLREFQNEKPSASSESFMDKKLSPVPSVAEEEKNPSKTSTVKLYYIDMNVPNHDGSVGCGDNVVGIDRPVEPTKTPLKTALETLLSTKDTMIGETGLYNSLAKQEWTLNSVSVANEEAIIRLEGEYVGIGTCEDPRIKAQLEKTALQFENVKKVSIFLNKVSLDKVMSAKGN